MRPLAEMPELDPALQPYWDAFWLLERHRQQGMNGPLPISMAEIMAFFSINSIDDADEREIYLRFISAMDVAYRDFLASKRQGNRGKGGAAL